MTKDLKKPWKPVRKAGELAESRLINAFLDGKFPVNSTLPAERELAELIGITRPTLREALQRLERDGWIEIQHGKPTRVCDYRTEGNLGVSIALAKYQNPLMQDFVTDLFSVRVLLAPAYFKSAVLLAPEKIVEFLNTNKVHPDSAEHFANFDWKLHWQLTLFSGNLFFTHFMNSVRELYEMVGVPYFSHNQTRTHSRKFYDELLVTAEKRDAHQASVLASKVMSESAGLWVSIMKKERETEK